MSVRRFLVFAALAMGLGLFFGGMMAPKQASAAFSLGDFTGGWWAAEPICPGGGSPLCSGCVQGKCEYVCGGRTYCLDDNGVCKNGPKYCRTTSSPGVILF
jgi:hypothetical protein